MSVMERSGLVDALYRLPVLISFFLCREMAPPNLVIAGVSVCVRECNVYICISFCVSLVYFHVCVRYTKLVKRQLLSAS